MTDCAVHDDVGEVHQHEVARLGFGVGVLPSLYPLKAIGEEKAQAVFLDTKFAAGAHGIAEVLPFGEKFRLPRGIENAQIDVAFKALGQEAEDGSVVDRPADFIETDIRIFPGVDCTIQIESQEGEIGDPHCDVLTSLPLCSYRLHPKGAASFVVNLAWALAIFVKSSSKRSIAAAGMTFSGFLAISARNSRAGLVL